MTVLLDQLLRNPGATFGYATNLPSGNRLSVSIGPLDGDDLATHVKFSQNPPSIEDVAATAQILGSQLALPAVEEIMRGFREGGDELDAGTDR